MIEINLCKSKWLLYGCYRPPRQSNDYFLHNLGNALDKFSKTYSNFLLVGDFNAEESNSSMAEFLNNYGAKNIVKEKTCFKSLNNPSCIDLFITNKPRSFQNTQTINIGNSDFHKMVLTVLKSSFKKCVFNNFPLLLTYVKEKKFHSAKKKVVANVSHMTFTVMKVNLLTTLNFFLSTK